MRRVGLEVRTLGFHPREHGFEPRTRYGARGCWLEPSPVREGGSAINANTLLFNFGSLAVHVHKVGRDRRSAFLKYQSSAGRYRGVSVLKPLWHNWIARRSTEPEVGGSNPSRGTGEGTVRFGYLWRKSDRMSTRCGKFDLMISRGEVLGRTHHFCTDRCVRRIHEASLLVSEMGERSCEEALAGESSQEETSEGGRCLSGAVHPMDRVDVELTFRVHDLGL